MTTDYSITWQYIVKRMEEKYGLKPDSTEKIEFGKIECYIERIWDEYVDKLDAYYAIVKNKGVRP